MLKKPACSLLQSTESQRILWVQNFGMLLYEKTPPQKKKTTTTTNKKTYRFLLVTMMDTFQNVPSSPFSLITNNIKIPGYFQQTVSTWMADCTIWLSVNQCWGVICSSSRLIRARATTDGRSRVMSAWHSSVSSLRVNSASCREGVMSFRWVSRQGKRHIRREWIWGQTKVVGCIFQPPSC